MSIYENTIDQETIKLLSGLPLDTKILLLYNGMPRIVTVLEHTENTTSLEVCGKRKIVPNKLLPMYAKPIRRLMVEN